VVLLADALSSTFTEIKNYAKEGSANVRFALTDMEFGKYK